MDFSKKEKQVVQIADRFYQSILYNLESQGISTVRLKKAKAAKWMDPIRLILKQEEVTEEDLNKLAQYLREDSFWRKVILSTSKMREKLPQLLMVMKEARQVATPWYDSRIFAYGKHDEADWLRARWES